MNPVKPQTEIIQQSLALDTYLRNLLDEVPSADEELETREIVELSLPEIGVPVGKALAVIEPQVLTTKSTPTLVDIEIPIKLKALAVMPEWAQQEFQALFFQVDQLILATPLIELSRTIKFDTPVNKIPGQPSWFLGLLDDTDSRIGVLDSGLLIFGKNRGRQRNLETQPYKRILITEDKRWGLACDEILSISKVLPEKVRWRTTRQKKPWLLGTVIEELTAIIDVRQLVPHRKAKE